MNISVGGGSHETIRLTKKECASLHSREHVSVEKQTVCRRCKSVEVRKSGFKFLSRPKPRRVQGYKCLNCGHYFY